MTDTHELAVLRLFEPPHVNVVRRPLTQPHMSCMQSTRKRKSLRCKSTLLATYSGAKHRVEESPSDLFQPNSRNSSQLSSTKVPPCTRMKPLGAAKGPAACVEGGSAQQSRSDDIVWDTSGRCSRVGYHTTVRDSNSLEVHLALHACDWGPVHLQRALGWGWAGWAVGWAEGCPERLEAVDLY